MIPQISIRMRVRRLAPLSRFAVITPITRGIQYGSLRFYTPSVARASPTSTTTTTNPPSTTSVTSSTSLSTKKRTTSLFNTARSFNEDESSARLNITNKKYSEQGQLLILDLTPRAVSKLTSLIETESNPDLALRISVESGGCHGFQYNLNLTDLSTVTEDDCIFEKNGARVIVDDASLAVLKESKLDYSTELIGSMFKVVESPYMVSSCGCGSSFDVDFEKLG